MSNRVAAALIAAGVIAGALVVLPYKLFELDRYFVPKELVLHVVALGLVILLMIWARDRDTDVVDKLLALFLAWSAASALFATNHWLAQRALGISVSSAIVFWGARRLGATGWHRWILVAGATAAVCAAVTGLAQAYGMELVYFSVNRAPGGTFGNRNFVAHFCAIGFPALIYVTVTARRPMGALLGSLGVLMISILLVLSRSRGAWLGLGMTITVGGMALLLSRGQWRGTVVRGRFARILLAATVGICAAIALPNRLNWRSDTPYLDSAISVVDYESGSGRGRLVQYSNSMRMALAHPVFGVGPGNWPVQYVRFATRGDGSIGDDGMTANPWPSSDWIAFVSERGIGAAGALLGVFAILFLSAARRWRELGDGDAVLVKVTLIATIVATMVVSAFDAVLLLGAPSLLAWSLIGATSGFRRVESIMAPPGRASKVAIALMLLVTIVSVARSAGQLAAISTVGTGWSRTAWLNASRWDPGSYRINQRMAETWASRGACKTARAFALQAQSLFPHAAAPKRTLRRCGG